MKMQTKLLSSKRLYSDLAPKAFNSVNYLLTDLASLLVSK